MCRTLLQPVMAGDRSSQSTSVAARILPVETASGCGIRHDTSVDRLVSAAVLTVAYFTYGRCWRGCCSSIRQRPTPAVELRDDVDYSPIEPKFLLSQHFSAIAAAGPIVGPILAGLMFGWLPALIWILVGVDLHRRRARHDVAGRLDPPQGALDRRGRPRPHERSGRTCCSCRSSGSRWSTSSWRSPTSRRRRSSGRQTLENGGRSSAAAGSPRRRCCTWRCRSSWGCCCGTRSCRSAGRR